MKDRNDIRLLSSMTEQEVLKWNEKGFFSITQLSYIFKPRKSRVLPKKNGRYKFELKSLAIREGKTFVLTTPKFCTVNTEVYFDFESLPNEKYVYLIGLIITENNKIISRKSFWANSIEEEEIIFNYFFNVLSGIPNPVFYHYGNFELKELDRFNKRHASKYDIDVNNVIDKSINILSTFYGSVYPPTYSNSLKEISNYIGFNWRKRTNTGLSSIGMRKKWERTGRKKIKNYLIEYNQEDCEALFRVTKWLQDISIEKEQNILQTNDLKEQGSLKFGKPDFIVDTFNKINNKAYFNYQHSKIYFRNSRMSQKKLPPNLTKNTIKANTTVLAERPDTCPRCKNIFLYIHQKYKRILIDLKFSKDGIKRWITDFKGYRFRCSHCGYVFTEAKYYKQPTFGSNIQIWIIYNYITYGISYSNLAKMLYENFNINVTRTYISSRKAVFAEKYANHYSKILDSITNGDVIHIDETSVKTKGIKGYVWVLTNLTDVYYIYRENRESGFLIEMLKDFRGILISDFYTGYDTLKCKQQKCLIHLMRDINDLFFKNQQNVELELIAKQFGNLMQIIVSTIDRFGLKAKHLKKHVNQVEKFYNEIERFQIESDIAKKIKTRLKKNKDRLFLFLNYDNISWNNNNAEFAVKAFARYRKNVDGIYNQKGLSDYLILLSIAQSCHYKDESFFEFLKSNEKSARDNKWS